MKTLIAIVLWLLLALQMMAQNNPQTTDLPDVLVHENRIETPFSESSRTINVITKEQIAAAPVVSVAELLHYVSGVDIRQRGAHGVQADVSIRGGTFDQVLILINGIKMSDPQTGHHALNLPVDISNIERIEILKGPGARIYGQNAFAGAINIITKTPEERFTQVSLQGGENALLGVRVGTALPTKNSKHYLSVARDQSDGYKYNTDYEITNLFYQSNFDLGGNQLNLLAGYTDRKFGANGFYASPDFMDQYEEVKTSIASAEYKIIKDNWVVKPRLYWRRNVDRYIFVRQDPSIYQNDHKGNVFGAEINSSFSSKAGTTGVGLDVNRTTLESNNLGERERTATSVFVEHRLSLLDGKLDITPGVLFNYYSDFDAVFLGGLDIGYRVSETVKFYANAGQTYRVPTYTDLYYEDRANIGNADLQPESAITYEVGTKYQTQRVQAQLSLFQRNTEEGIDWTKEVDTLRWQPRNFAAINMNGLDASLGFFFPESTWLQQLNVGYTYINASIETDEDIKFSRYALDNLQHQLIAGVDVRLFANLHSNIQFRYNDRVNLGDYSLLDWRLSWRTPKLNVFAEATNLFDVEYKETNLVTMPGRWLRAGVSYKFMY